MQSLDSTIVATALPNIATTFGEPPLRLSIVIIAYMLGQCVFTPVSAWMADRFGANVAFRGAIILFTVASILCGFSQNLWELTAARLLQGIGGSMMMPVGRLLLLRSVEGSEFLRANTYLALLGQLGPMLGPPIGGVFATYISWRWIFLINAPIGVAGVLLASKYIQNFRADVRSPFDSIGFVLTGIALSCVMYGLDSTGHQSIGIPVVAALVCGGALLGYTAWRSMHMPAPLLDFALYRIGSFRLNITAGTLFRFTNATSTFLLPLLFQVGFGMPAFKSGLLLFAFSAGTVTVRKGVEVLVRRTSFRTLMTSSCSVLTLLLPLFILLSVDTPLVWVVLLLLATGLLQALLFVVLNTLAYLEIPPQKMSVATSLGQLGNQVGNSLGVAIVAALLQVVLALRGGSVVDVADFGPAFIFMTACGLGAVLIFIRTPADLGEALRGKRKASVAPPEP